MMTRWVLLLVLVVCWAPQAGAQPPRLKVGVAAGPVRSFVYPRRFSQKGRYDYVQADGQLGYQLSLQAEKPLAPRLAYQASVRFVRTPTYYDVILVVPAAFALTRTWLAQRQAYGLYQGVAYTVRARGQQQWRVLGGLLAGVETQRLQLDRPVFAAYNASPGGVSEAFTYTSPRQPIWLIGAELGVGVRFANWVDLNGAYTYGLTRTAAITYASSLTYEGAPGSPRVSSGTLTGRPTFARAELVFWFE